MTCPRHGWRCDLATGDCLTDPARPLRRFAVREEDGAVQLEIGAGPHATHNEDEKEEK